MDENARNEPLRDEKGRDEKARDENDGAAVRFPPPLIYLGAVILGVVAHAYIVPLSMTLSPGLRISMGMAAAVLGLVLMVGAVGLFRRTGQNPTPWKPTPEIISTGVYRITRNPMYVGMALLQIAIGIGLGNWWIIILLPVVLAIVYGAVVRHEERYLEEKFEDAYRDYKKAVRRWL